MEPIEVEPFRLGHRPWLDGLRGVAVLMVLAFHFGFLPGGSIGVDIFFVLSGFLITTILAEEWRDRGAIGLRRFYIRRALRLLPAFALLLAMFAAEIPFFADPAERTGALRELGVVACYVSNWPTLHNVGTGHLGHTWSLSVEEQFYLLWPIGLLAMFRMGMSRRRILMVVIAGIVLSAVDRLILYRLLKSDGPDRGLYTFRLYMGLDTRADALLVGCLTGLCAVWGCLPRGADLVLRLAAAASVLGIGWLSWFRCLDHSQFYHGLFTVAALMVATVIVCLLTAEDRPLLARALEFSPFLIAGRLSYGLYLYHIPVLRWLGQDMKGWQNPARCISAAALTLALAVVSYLVVERPFMRLKSRFENRRSANPPLETPAKLAA
jgi:peptidoglycan/LPS O-acetylase OafA/YrhL